MNLTIGFYDEEVVAALAYDLAARLLGEDRGEFNFSNDELRELVPVYGDELVRGLNKKLPRGLREAMARLVDMFRTGRASG